MNQEQEEIRDQQKASWNKFSAGWKKWDDMTMDFLRPVGDEMVRLLDPNGDQNILDVASGTGEPGMTIASMLEGGSVTLTDLSEDMLAIAKENAGNRGLENVTTVACDVCALPFPEATFDAVSCRFGFMFFPDMQFAAQEIFRVLKPGGRVVTSVWNVPEKNFWVTAIGGTINRIMSLPHPQPGAPGMFRCAPSGLVQELFQKAGLKNTSEREVATSINSGTVDVYWAMMTEVAAPFVAALSNADDATRAQIKAEVFQLVNERFPDGVVNIPASALVVIGEKD